MSILFLDGNNIDDVEVDDIDWLVDDIDWLRRPRPAALVGLRGGGAAPDRPGPGPAAAGGPAKRGGADANAPKSSRYDGSCWISGLQLGIVQ